REDWDRCCEPGLEPTLRRSTLPDRSPQVQQRLCLITPDAVGVRRLIRPLVPKELAMDGAQPGPPCRTDSPGSLPSASAGVLWPVLESRPSAGCLLLSRRPASC